MLPYFIIIIGAGTALGLWLLSMLHPGFVFLIIAVFTAIAVRLSYKMKE